MQDFIAALAALAGILLGFWLRAVSARREKLQHETRLKEIAADLANARADLTQAQSVADARAGFESLAAERERTAGVLAVDRDNLRIELRARLENERQQSSRVSA